MKRSRPLLLRKSLIKEFPRIDTNVMENVNGGMRLI